MTASLDSAKEHPLTVAELRNAKIIGDLRLVATSQDVVVAGMQRLFGCAEPQGHYILRRRRLRMLKRWRGTALLLGAANSDNYYHWMVESVPRWKMLQAANWSDYDFVLLHSASRSFQDEVLERLNVPREKRLRCSKNFVHQFERLVVPSMPFPPEHVASWACVYLRSLFPEKAHGPEKIYLRRGAGRRRLVNEAELEGALAEIGFSPVDSSRLTVMEQAKLMGSARWVVAPHGAALTNTIFAPPGALILDILNPQHRNNCIPNIAAACGHRYVELNGRVTNRAGARLLEYAVDIPSVLRLVADRGLD
ncbi:MAG: glycosyltransferase family 61 protein [Limisphaerales bacterium]